MMYFKKSISFFAVLTVAAIVVTSSCKKNEDISASGNTPSSIGSGVSGSANTDVVTGCGAGSGLTVVPVSPFGLYNGTSGSALYCNWVSGSGVWVALFINGQLYKDPGSGYGLYSIIANGVYAQCCAISGGIQPSETFKVFTRTYCNSDTTGSIQGVTCFDSPTTTIVVPSTFSSTCGSTGGTTTKKGHGGHTR